MLTEKIKDKKARIGVIGLGYVGLPLVIGFGRAGFKVTGLDIDDSKIKRLLRGESYIKHIPGESIKELVDSGLLDASTNFSVVSKLDCMLICVPTPLDANREPNMDYIISTARSISPFLTKDQIIILESTTYPGTTKDLLVPELESATELKANKDFFIAYSPEREDPNNKKYSTKDIPKVIGADSDEALKIADALYSSILNKTVLVSDTMTAEATKLLENIFRAVNIALVNEMKVILDKMGIDVWEVIKAADTKPFGFMPFYPGPGLGGHCIPIDPFYLTWKAREYGVATRFIELAGEINVGMPEYVIQKIIGALNDKEKSVKGSHILLLGLAYKQDVDDTRESPSYKVMALLEGQGAKVDFNDPHVDHISQKRDYPQFVGKKGVSLENMGEYDLVVILTAHKAYDYGEIVSQAKIIVDTRNACGDIKSEKIIKA
ncbi:MAG: nucleotide sugar dehydrogenase [Nitrospinales bacterium]